MKKLNLNERASALIGDDCAPRGTCPTVNNGDGLADGTHAESARRILRQQAGKWTGCAWRTCFGKSELDLDGMNSAQARIMARATSGPEGADWRAAVQWLAQVENDAAEAERAAAEAVALAEKKKWTSALALAERACALEYRHHNSSIWQPLRHAIETAQEEVAN